MSDTTYYDTSSSVLDARPLFFVDRRGDPLNVQYGGLHAGNIPKHRLVAGMFVDMYRSTFPWLTALWLLVGVPPPRRTTSPWTSARVHGSLPWS